MIPRHLTPIIYMALMVIVLAVPWVEGGAAPQAWLWLLSALVFLAMAVGWCVNGHRFGFPDVHTAFRQRYRRYREDFKTQFIAASGCSEDQAIDFSLDARLQEAVLDDVPLAEFVKTCAKNVAEGRDVFEVRTVSAKKPPLIARLFSVPSGFIAWIIYLFAAILVDDFVSAHLLFAAATAVLAVFSVLSWAFFVGPYFGYSKARVIETSRLDNYSEEFRNKLIALTGCSAEDAFEISLLDQIYFAVDSDVGATELAASCAADLKTWLEKRNT